MKLGIMQPYFFPYIGYWQLLNAVDKYVVYDDVNFIKNGWINRNRILVAGKPQWFTLPLNQASPFKKINEIEITSDEKPKNKLLKTLDMAYHKAPYFKPVFELFQNTLGYSSNLSQCLYFSIQHTAKYLGIQTEIILSSKLDKNNELKGKDKVIHICKQLNANQYFNAAGGQTLYNKTEFAAQEIALHFLQTQDITYPQFKYPFIANLSILDVMMFNAPAKIQEFLKEYELK